MEGGSLQKSVTLIRIRKFLFLVQRFRSEAKNMLTTDGPYLKWISTHDGQTWSQFFILSITKPALSPKNVLQSRTACSVKIPTFIKNIRTALNGPQSSIKASGFKRELMRCLEFSLKTSGLKSQIVVLTGVEQSVRIWGHTTKFLNVLWARELAASAQNSSAVQ